jgi:hypothetical protein
MKRMFGATELTTGNGESVRVEEQVDTSDAEHAGIAGKQ